MTKKLLNISTALHCEAKPLIAALQLKKIISPLPLPIFVNKEKNIHLIVTGVGKIKMAVGTTFLQTFTGNEDCAAFLNVGIAGSSQCALGQMVVANKIIDHSTNRNYYPFVSPLKNKLQSTLITHDFPQNVYPEIGMVDMEGSAFFQAASQFVTQEHIQVVKVISDNSIETQKKISEQMVAQSIENALPAIFEVIDYLNNLSEKEFAFRMEPNDINQFHDQWHFTHAQSLQLTKYLKRWKVQRDLQDPFLFCKQEKNAKSVINKIISELKL